MDEFLIQFPVYAIVNPAAALRGDNREAFVPFKVPELGDVLPLFTDTDLAARFLEAVPLPFAAITRPVTDVPMLVAILRMKLEHGVQHIGFDISFAPGRAPSGRFFTTQELLQLAGVGEA